VTPPDSETIERLFTTAHPLTAPQREELLRRECGGDTALRQEVESLLRAADESESYFSKLTDRVSALALADAVETSESNPGDVVGPYTLVSLLGVGGMGEVWKAQRSDRLIERFVALKLPHGTWQRRGLAERASPTSPSSMSKVSPSTVSAMDMRWASTRG
jgi:hypothetical protein